MPPSELALRRNDTATFGRLVFALCMVGAVVIVSGIVWFIDTLTGTFGSNVPLVLFLMSPLLAVAAYITWLTLRPVKLVVHADGLEVVHPRLLRRPLVVPRANVRAVHLDDGSAAGAARFPTGDDGEPFLWTNRLGFARDPLRPLIGDGVLPNIAVELRDPMTIEQARGSWGAIPVRLEPEPPPRDVPVTHLMLTVKDPRAAEAALGGWPVRRPTGEAVLAPELVPGTGQELDVALIFMSLMVLMPFYVHGNFKVVPLQVLLTGAAYARWSSRSRAATQAAREGVEAQPPERRAAAAAAAEANYGPLGR